MLVKFSVKPEYIEVFKDAGMLSALNTRKETANLEMKMFVDDNNPNIFYISEHWTNKTGLENHRNQPYAKNASEVSKYTLQCRLPFFRTY